MIVKQNLSILFYHKKKKARKADCKTPIYFRITKDGLDDEISTGVYVLPIIGARTPKTFSPTHEIAPLHLFSMPIGSISLTFTDRGTSMIRPKIYMS